MKIHQNLLKNNIFCLFEAKLTIIETLMEMITVDYEISDLTVSNKNLLFCSVLSRNTFSFLLSFTKQIAFINMNLQEVNIHHYLQHGYSLLL